VICVCIQFTLSDLKVLHYVSCGDSLINTGCNGATHLLWHNLIQRIGATSKLLASITVAALILSDDLPRDDRTIPEDVCSVLKFHLPLRLAAVAFSVID
jgi:hypothetical protein